MYGYIYKTTNLVNGKIYIGQKKSDKFLGNNYLGSGKTIQRAINRYGSDNFEVELLEKIDTVDHMDEREIYWIAFYNSTNKDIGYNISTGGKVNRMVGEHNPFYKKTHSEEAIKKIKEANYGKIPWNKGLTKECDKRVAKYSEALTGRDARVKNYIWIRKMIDDEIVTKMINPSQLKQFTDAGWELGRNHLPGHKWAQDKRRINNGIEEKNVFPEELEYYLNAGWTLGRRKFKNTSNYGKHNRKAIICITTGEVFESANDAYRKTGIYPAPYCKGLRKPQNGYVWKYLEDYEKEKEVEEC